jgi:hypothetical protein
MFTYVYFIFRNEIINKSGFNMGYFYVCLGCHNLHLHYKRLSNLAFLVSREYKNKKKFAHCFILKRK